MVAMLIQPNPYDILITDDDAGCRETVCDVLAENGYRTHAASCGEEAIEVAREHPVQLLIVDMNMPDLSGLETVSIIRREIRFMAHVPSILMSSDSSLELKLRAIKTHIESFMPKPVKIRVLRHVVEQIIRKTYGE
jgi:DNA-binding response OmpR family regulator